MAENEKKEGKQHEAKEAYKRLDALKEKRQTFDQHWQEISDYFSPNKNTITRESYPGEKRTLHIYDSTPIKAKELLTGALHSMLTNPSAYWFEYTTGVPNLDRDDEVRMWLQKATHITHEIMNNSNFQTEIHELYEDQVTFGHGVMSIEEDQETVVRFSTKQVKDCWLDENARGEVDTVYRCFKWKPRNIISEFGDAVPKFVHDKEDSAPEQEIELLQVVRPNSEYSKAKKLSIEGKLYKSCTYIKDGSECFVLEEKGFNTFPYVTPRWTKGTGEVYGRSPAMTALSDAKMINEMMKETIRAQQKKTNPPMLVPDDGVIGSLRLTPGGLNYFRSGSGDFIKPLDSGVDLILSFDMINDVRSRIRDCFYIDQLQLQDGPQMTATEVMQRTEEQVRHMGPVLGRQQHENLRRTIDRVFDIIAKRNLFPPYPRALSGRKIDVKYRSMLAKAQLATEANNIMRVFQGASAFLKVDPKSAHVINADEGVRYIANLFGLPQELLNSKKKVEEMRKAIEEAQAEAMQAQKEQAGVEQVAKLAPAAKIANEMNAG